MHIRELNLEQIEADVVIIFYNDDLGHHRIMPLWECDIKPEHLQTYATREALTFAEQCGGGFVDFHIRDYRGERRLENAPTATPALI